MSEGTYPYAMGGVSVWCDQLMRGLSDYRWEMVALTVDNSERPVWRLPENLDRVTAIPLWGPGGDRRRGVPPKEFTEPYQEFLLSLVTPLDPRPERAVRENVRFIAALRGLHEYAASGGDLSAAMMSNRALAMMMDAWHTIQADGLTLADATQGAWSLEHMLRPLSVPAVEADVVHASMNGLSMLVGLVAKWTHGTPLLLSEHGIYLRERYISYLDEDTPHPVKVLILNFFRCLAGGAYLACDALAPHSGYNRRWQLRNGAEPDRMWTMYNGVAPESFPPALEEPPEPTIVFAGRVDPLKDLHTLIRAFAIVREKLPDARLRMFGGTPAGNEVYHDSCVALIEELGLTGAAVLEGRIEDMVEAYHSGSIVALTSISEGFPYTVVEAMACGRTVVCTNVGGVSEAVGDAGFVVAPRDSAAVAEACVRLLDDAELRHELAAKARNRVLERFTLAQSLDAYRNLYERLSNPELTAEPAPPAPDMVYVGRVAISRYVGRVAREITAEPAVPEAPAEPHVGRATVNRYVGRVAQSDVESAEQAA
ncbi:lipopolysaccharide glycosyltransferase, putative [Asanoa ishikariensis]|uniref:GT4 family glycosyltransferase PelF n=1 Tax=Asanoa ishikariensis TaxID=137265 RepID=UPI001A61366E|nr:GT4 family glycosyltransferase PelF [Asanoa ishikariensis]GIF68783.1 lipopolysaccharide glycosyltransferase, putative [Asanoa ishikariensis]